MTSIANSNAKKSDYLQKYGDIVDVFLENDNGRWRSRMWRELGGYQEHVLGYAIRREKSLTGSDINNPGHNRIFAIGLSAAINHVAGVVFARERREKKQDWYWSPVMLRNALTSPRDSLARKVRSNIRRAIELEPDKDMVEAALLYQAQQEDQERVVGFDGSYTSHQAKKDRKRRQDARNYTMNQALATSAMLELHLTPFLMTLTLPGEFHGCSDLRDAEEEINRRFNNIKQTCIRRGIPLLGAYCIEPHKDETPHLHLALYTHPGQSESLNGIIRRQFRNNHDAEMEPVEDIDEWLDYIEKKVDEPFRKRVGFIGMAKGIKGRWDSCYEGKAVPGLDPRKLSLVHRLMKDKKRIGDWLFIMRGFRDEKYNAKLDEQINKELGIDKSDIIIDDINIDAEDDDDILQVNEDEVSITPAPVHELDEDGDDEDDEQEHGNDGSNNDDSEQVITMIPGVGHLTVMPDESQVIVNINDDTGTWNIPGAVSVEQSYIDNSVTIRNGRGQDIFQGKANGRISVNIDVMHSMVTMRVFRDKEVASLTSWSVSKNHQKMAENCEEKKKERKLVNILDKDERGGARAPEAGSGRSIAPPEAPFEPHLESVQEQAQQPDAPEKKIVRFRHRVRRGPVRIINPDAGAGDRPLADRPPEDTTMRLVRNTESDESIARMTSVIAPSHEGPLSNGQENTIVAVLDDVARFLGRGRETLTVEELADGWHRLQAATTRPKHEGDDDINIDFEDDDDIDFLPPPGRPIRLA